MDKTRARRDLHLAINNADNTMRKNFASQASKTQK